MILLNNQFVSRDEGKVDIEDRGYQFGDGVYEVIRVYNGKLFSLAEHLERFKRSMVAISLKLPYASETLTDNLKTLVEKNNLRNGIIYIQITRGAASRNHGFPNNTTPVISAYTKEISRPIEALNSGISAHLVEDFRWLRCDIKSLNLLGNVLAKQEALDHGCQEAIFHRGERVTEGSSTNVFIIRAGKLLTHPADNFILNGITRRYVIELACQLGLPVIEKSFTLNELLTADEVFVTSTTQEVMPVVKINQSTIAEGRVGKWTQLLQNAFESAITSP
ncbi:D-alanine transaminase [Pullulanibacillus pueri]|uniref:D-alanine aminotransferase n=1 Tax=Pullulanibacillus pueri TaxID=1437324 RepID=A0A8J2ZWB4_9BACL|nr:D-amino-acid transaminase [Pullulanibacillus pueri]MBM7682309.1 D-alanine transaminase [Pullulanibacillus pueri]GGH80850.1 D-alanine aminotransferase [Pullulanibacillus pueri]